MKVCDHHMFLFPPSSLVFKFRACVTEDDCCCLVVYFCLSTDFGFWHRARRAWPKGSFVLGLSFLMSRWYYIPGLVVESTWFGLILGCCHAECSWFGLILDSCLVYYIVLLLACLDEWDKGLGRAVRSSGPYETSSSAGAVFPCAETVGRASNILSEATLSTS